MIPKKLHYVWVGDKTLGKIQQKCISSWKKYLLESEWEYRFWNEDSIPAEVMQHPYVKKMYKKKKWAFVSDYIRFWALEREGGIYLDTDTEVLKNFDNLLSHEAFFGRTKDGVIAAGVIGSVANHQVIRDVLKIYDEDRVFNTYNTSPHIVTRVLEGGAYKNVTVYDYQYFNPCNDGEKCTKEKLKLAYTNNHWAESWVSYVKLRKFLRRTGMMSLIKMVLNKEL